jgi:hypothetical protein
MTVVATAARGVGLALLLVPVPFVIALLVGAARSDRVNVFLVWILGITLLPAIWLTALRLGWSGCSGCLHQYQSGAMLFVAPAVPLLVAALVLLFMRRASLATDLMIAAQALMAIGLAKVNTTGLVLMAAFVAVEVAYLGLTAMRRASPT